MARPPRPLPDGLPDAFTVADARAHGVPVGRLRALDLDRPFRGIRSVARAPAPPDPGDPLSLDRAERAEVLHRVRAYALIMPDEAFFAGRTAAVLHGLPVPHTTTAGDDRLCVAVPAPRRALRAHGIQGVKVAPGLAHVHVHGGFRISSPASTWAMLASELDERELVIAGDAIVRIPRDATARPRSDLRLATMDHLRRAAAAPRRRGRALLERAIARIRVGSMSPLETDFRLQTGDAGLPEPELDVEIREDGRLLGIADAVYREHDTIVEVEGDHHRLSRTQWNRDIAKHAAYAAAGWQVVRLTAANLRARDPDAARIVRAALARRGWSP